MHQKLYCKSIWSWEVCIWSLWSVFIQFETANLVSDCLFCTWDKGLVGYQKLRKHTVHADVLGMYEAFQIIILFYLTWLILKEYIILLFVLWNWITYGSSAKSLDKAFINQSIHHQFSEYCNGIQRELMYFCCWIKFHQKGHHLTRDHFEERMVVLISTALWNVYGSSGSILLCSYANMEKWNCSCLSWDHANIEKWRCSCLS